MVGHSLVASDHSLVASGGPLPTAETRRGKLNSDCKLNSGPVVAGRVGRGKTGRQPEVLV